MAERPVMVSAFSSKPKSENHSVLKLGKCGLKIGFQFPMTTKYNYFSFKKEAWVHFVYDFKSLDVSVTYLTFCPILL